MLHSDMLQLFGCFHVKNSELKQTNKFFVESFGLKEFIRVIKVSGIQPMAPVLNTGPFEGI